VIWKLDVSWNYMIFSKKNFSIQNYHAGMKYRLNHSDSDTCIIVKMIVNSL
jgi:hypothetical protein